MTEPTLMELVEAGDYDAFELRCLELLDSGAARLADFAAPLECLQGIGQGQRAATLGQIVLENLAVEEDHDAGLRIAHLTLLEDPDNRELRELTLDLYKRAHARSPGFAAILEASGLASGRPARNALRLLDVCLKLRKGDSLISRMDGSATELMEIEPDQALYTLRAAGRVATIPAIELVREYEPVDAGDFRALRQLNPERVAQMLHDDPVGLVIGMLHAHGEFLDTDVLKHDLVPQYLAAKEWPKWWTRARALLKKSPYVAIEGRSPMLLSYVPEGRTLEDETWMKYQAQTRPAAWVRTVESYLREKTGRKEEPDAVLLERFRAHLHGRIEALCDRRPAEALTCSLALDRLSAKGLPIGEPAHGRSALLLREADDPIGLVSRLDQDMFWDQALGALAEAFPEDSGVRMVGLIPAAPASMLDRIVAAALAAGQFADVQQHLDAALARPHEHAEIIYWLWKGARQAEGIALPSDEELFAVILDTLAVLGRTLTPPLHVLKTFRARMKSALALKGYAKARRCVETTGSARAVTVRGQVERLEGLGENVRRKLLGMLHQFHSALWAKAQERVEPWEDPNVLWTTQAGLHTKTVARDRLVGVEMRENARRIGEAASHGDLSENAEYRFALEERDLLRARLARINEDLSIARVLTAHDVPTDRAGIGSRVTLRNTADGFEREMTFLGPFDTDADKGVYNYKSPVGQKLMGTRVGDRVVLPLDGQDHELEVAALGNALNASGE